LLHELAHLILGTTGISGASANKTIERFCNDAASEYLLPAGELAGLRVNRQTAFDPAVQSISEFARVRNLSGTMIAYRLYRADAISRDVWQQLTKFFHDQWVSGRATRRELARSEEGGPSYYVVKRHRLGSALLALVQRTLSAGTLTPTKAGRMLGVKPRNVEPLLALPSSAPASRGR
jgi:Zn-dependent peptidase ImmA (M78 family)